MNRGYFTSSAACAALALTTARAPATAEADALVTQLLWIKNVEYAGFWIADANKYFAQESVAPTFLAGGPNLASVEAIVASGRADVGIDELEKVVEATQQGAPFVVFGAIYQHAVAGLLSLPKNPIRTARDIVGKRIGLQQGAKEYIDAILTINKLPLDYTEVPVGFDPQPLVEGACDAYLCYVTSQPLVLAAKNIPYVVTSFARLGYAGYSSALFTTRDFLRTHRPVLVRYVRAAIRGWSENRKDPAFGATLAVERYGRALGLDRAQQVAQNRAQVPLIDGAARAPFHGVLAVDPHMVAGRVYATLRAQGLKTLPPVESLVDTTIWRDAAYPGRSKR